MGDDPRRTSEEAQRSLPHLMQVISAARAPQTRWWRFGRPAPGAPPQCALELGSGSGEHLRALARRYPELTWQPSDPDPLQRASVAAWTAGQPNVRPPLDLDVTLTPWPLEPTEPLVLVLAVHLLHIAPARAIEALTSESARRLAPGGLLVVHDAFLDADGQPPSPRMADFDRTLRARDRRAGLRRLDALTTAAIGAGLEPLSSHPYGPDLLTLTFAHRR